MKNKLTKSIKSTPWLFFILALLMSVKPVIDPDLGWHLGVGRFIWKEGVIPKTDIFSFSLPDYPYVYHSWLTESVIYPIYSNFGIWGVSLMYSLLFAVSFLLQALIVRRKTEKKYSIYFLLFFIPFVVWVVGARTQTVSFLLLTLLVYFFSKYSLSSSILWFLPLVFLLWVNLHGGFLLGLGFLGILILLKLVNLLLSKPESKNNSKIVFKSISIFISSVVACFINPYGFRVFSQAFLMAANRFSSRYNLDWKPLFTYKPHTLITGGLIGLFIILAFLDKRRTNWRDKIFILLLFFFSLKSRRFVMPLFVILLPTLIPQIELAWKKLNKGNFITRLPLILAISTVTFSFGGVVIRDYFKTKLAYENPQYYATELPLRIKYPYNAISFFEENGVPNRMLNDINWGGYLLLHFPDDKFFIDGRMDNFRVNNQSFAEIYWGIINLHPGWKEHFDRYEFSAVLAPLQNDYHWPLVEYLRLNDDWEIVLEDEVSILLIKKIS